MKISALDKMKNIFRIGFILLMLWPAALQATDAILTRLSGEVQILRKGKATPMAASPGMQLSFGDTVQTWKGAKAHLLFLGGNAVLVKELTTLCLTGSTAKVYLRVPRGEFLIGIKKKLGKRESFRVWTPACVSAVRGTLFWGLSDDKLNSSYASFKDPIAVTAKGHMITINSGEKVFVEYGKPPGKKEPSTFAPDYMDTFEIDGSVEDIKNILR